MGKNAVLVIDDNESTRTLLRLILEAEGFVVHSCKNGPAALELVRKSSFDIFLIDFLLPIMKGDETARRIRSSCPDAYIIGASVDWMEEDFLKAGADVFVNKFEMGSRLVPLLHKRCSSGMVMPWRGGTAP